MIKWYFKSCNCHCFHVQIKFNMAHQIFQWLPLIFNDFSRQNAIFPGQHKIQWLFKSRVKFHDFSRPVRTMPGMTKSSTAMIFPTGNGNVLSPVQHRAIYLNQGWVILNWSHRNKHQLKYSSTYTIVLWRNVIDLKMSYIFWKLPPSCLCHNELTHWGWVVN